LNFAICSLPAPRSVRAGRPFDLPRYRPVWGCATRFSNFAFRFSIMTVYKCPFEQFDVSLDFSNDVGAGNTITSISAVAAISNLTGEDSTAEVIAAAPPAISGSGTAVVFEVCGGVVGETHTISVQIVSSIGEKYQGDVTLRIVE